MALKVTRWRPDTCNCIIEYEWDDSLPPDQIVLTLKNIVGKCDEHTGLSDTDTYKHVKDENKTKNDMLGELIKIDRLREAFIDNDGNTMYRLRPGVIYEWGFSGRDGSRELNVTLRGGTLTALEKLALRNRGIKKVNV